MRTNVNINVGHDNRNYIWFLFFSLDFIISVSYFFIINFSTFILVQNVLRLYIDIVNTYYVYLVTFKF